MISSRAKKTLGQFAVLILLTGSVAAANIVKDGIPKSEIILGEKPTDSELYASKELQRVVKLMSGAELRINSTGKKIPGKFNIIIGTPQTNPLIKANSEISKKLSNKDFCGQEFVIETTPEGVFLAGNGKIGALYATYEFIEFLGVRWLWPGKTGEFIPSGKIVAAPEINIFSKPAFTARGFRGRYGVEGGIWMARNKLNYGHRDLRLLKDKAYTIGFGKNWGGHSFGWIVPEDCKGTKGKLAREEYFEKHPDHFSLVAGKRTLRQQCYSNPEVQKVFSDWIKRFWRDNPDVEILNLAPMDNPTFCECENCKKFGSDQSSQLHRFLDIIIKEVEKKYPGKKYKTYAYSCYKPAPQCEVNKNLIVEYCMHDRCYKHLLNDETCLLNKKALKEFNKWTKKNAAEFFMYGYHYDAVRSPKTGILMPLTPIVQDELKFLKEHNYKGFATESGGKFEFSPKNQWAANQIGMYVISKLEWNPDLKAEDILKDACDTAYGPASSKMQEYYKTMWKAWMGKGHVSGYFSNPIALADNIMTLDVIKKADSLFSEANDIMKNSPETPENERSLKNLQLAQDVYLNWKKLSTEKYTWMEIARGKGKERIKFLKDAYPEKNLYSEDFQNSTSLEKSDGFSPVCSLKTEEGGNRFISVANKKGETHVFKLHSKRFNNGYKWINYEMSFRFRFPEGIPSKQRFFAVILRNNGVKFIDDFRNYYVNVRENLISASIRQRNGKPVPIENGMVKFKDIGMENLAAGKWHKARIRVIDNKMFVWVTEAGFDEKMTNEFDVPLGGGAVNIMTFGEIDVDDILVRKIPEPSNEKKWSYLANFTNSPPKIDGAPDDSCWKNAAVVKNFVSKSETPIQNDTEVRALWDKKAMYMLIKCNDKNLDGVIAKRTKPDDDQWSDNSIELFIDPQRTRLQYYYLVANSLGSKFDALGSPGPSIDKNWNGKWNAKVSKGDKCWWLEIKLPMKTFKVKDFENPWHMGICRSRRNKDGGENSSWTDGSYHNPASFRTVYLVK